MFAFCSQRLYCSILMKNNLCAKLSDRVKLLRKLIQSYQQPVAWENKWVLLVRTSFSNLGSDISEVKIGARDEIDWESNKTLRARIDWFRHESRDSQVLEMRRSRRTERRDIPGWDDNHLRVGSLVLDQPAARPAARQDQPTERVQDIASMCHFENRYG